MYSFQRLAYSAMNVVYGATIGAALAILTLQSHAWDGHPSGALLVTGSTVIFGAAYLATVTARGQRPTMRGVIAVVLTAAAVLAAATLAVSAPAWVLVWSAAGFAGFVTGVLAPLASMGRHT